MRLSLTLIFVAVFICVIMFDFPRAAKGRKDKRRLIYIVFLSFSFLVIMLHIYGIKLPSHFKVVQNLIERVFHISGTGQP